MKHCCVVHKQLILFLHHVVTADLLFAQCNDEKGMVNKGQVSKRPERELDRDEKEGRDLKRGGEGDTEGGGQMMRWNYASLKLD